MPMLAPRFISDNEVLSEFTLERAYESQREAFLGLASGEAYLAERVTVPAEGDGPFTFSYVARLNARSGIVTKVGSVQASNTERGLPVVSALITCLDAVTGQPVAIIDGTSVTTLRTSAATAVALDTLRRDRTGLHVAIVGAGVQGLAHIRSLGRLDAVDQITLVTRQGRRPAANPSTECPVHVTNQLSAVRRAHVVVLCTPGTKPLLSATDVKSDAVVISIGSYSAELSEVTVDLIEAAALVAVDHRATALAQAGSIIAAVDAAAVQPAALAELGDLLVGSTPIPPGLIFYNSVGIGVQDSAAAWSITTAITSKDQTA